MRCEEQEDLDRLKIALYGHKDGMQQQAEQAAFEAKKAAAGDSQAGTRARGGKAYDSLKRGSTVDHTQSRSTRQNYNNAFDQVAALDSILAEGVDTRTMNSSIMRSPQSTR